MNIHILGICGTFMGSLARLIKACGHTVSGSDQNVYPPMSTQLDDAGIELFSGWGLEQFDRPIDLVIVGNAMSRGNPAIEYVLNRHIPYTSGPAWLAENVLSKRWVLAVAGTHGKTTTSSMLAWILQYAGFEPGYLIGGVPANFEVSASLGKSDFFVIEADEYDTAFFDKRSKCVHYQPDTLVLNNLEFDHADIFADLRAIQVQLHHCVRTVPSNGTVIFPADDKALSAVIDMGCWSNTISLDRDEEKRVLTETAQENAHYSTRLLGADDFSFEVRKGGSKVGCVKWSLLGQHNVENALSAITAAHTVGVSIEDACAALETFKGVKRRMEVLHHSPQLAVYDDFAHHPTAIQSTLEGLRRRAPDSTIIAVIEPRSNTMKMGVHQQALVESAASADEVWWYLEDASWQLAEDDTPDNAGYRQVTNAAQHLEGYANQGQDDQSLNDQPLNDQREYRSFSCLLEQLTERLQSVVKPSEQSHPSTSPSAVSKDAQTASLQVVLMSNGSFNGLSQKLKAVL